MPNDVKAYVSAAVAVVAIVLAFWSGSPVRPEFGNFVLATAAFMIVAMGFFQRPAETRKRRKISAIGGKNADIRDQECDRRCETSQFALCARRLRAASLGRSSVCMLAAMGLAGPGSRHRRAGNMFGSAARPTTAITESAGQAQAEAKRSNCRSFPLAGIQLEFRTGWVPACAGTSGRCQPVPQLRGSDVVFGSTH